MPNNILNGWRRAITKITLALLLLYVLAMSVPVIATNATINSKWICGDSSDLYQGLTELGETAVATGIVGDDLFFMSFWANAETGTWTVVVSKTKDYGKSCMVLEGTNYRNRKRNTLLHSI
jgi:hypothetical protein